MTENGSTTHNRCIQKGWHHKGTHILSLCKKNCPACMQSWVSKFYIITHYLASSNRIFSYFQLLACCCHITQCDSCYVIASPVCSITQWTQQLPLSARHVPPPRGIAILSRCGKRCSKEVLVRMIRANPQWMYKLWESLKLCEMSGVTLRDTSHTWNVRNVVGVTLLSHIPPQPPHTISSTTRTTPWIIQGVVREKYSGSSKVLSPPREWPGPAYRKASWALRRFRRGYPTPTIDKVSFCFVNPTYLL